MTLSHPVFPFPCRKLYALSIVSGLCLFVLFVSFLFFSCFLVFSSPFSLFPFSFAGCLPPLLRPWCGECAGAYCTAVVFWYYWCTLTYDFLFFLLFVFCFFAPRLTAPPGVWCRAGDAWSAGTRYRTLRRCRRVWEAFSVLSFYFILIGLIDALSRLVR